MSGFDPEWLALRETADQRARDRTLMAKLGARVGRRDGVTVLDLGCGAGSNLRALAPVLPQAWQSWTLVDHDTALLEAAVEALEDWADDSENFGEELILTKGEKRLTVDLRKLDLASEIDKALDWRPDLVTASALFDLVSESWMLAFAIGVARRGIGFYTSLSYDGREEWTPAHPADQAVNAVFQAHQTRDKGFGPAAGPAATAILGQAFLAAGYAVETAKSPWRLGAEDKALIGALAKGIAAAVRETGDVPEAEIADWLAAREAEGVRSVIGHEDLLALPK